MARKEHGPYRTETRPVIEPGAKLRPTKHAEARRLDQGLTTSQIREVVLHPDEVRQSFEADRWNYIKRLADEPRRVQVVVKFEGLERVPVIITVRWADKADWASDAKRGPLPAGRFVPKGATA